MLQLQRSHLSFRSLHDHFHSARDAFLSAHWDPLRLGLMSCCRSSAMRPILLVRDFLHPVYGFAIELLCDRRYDSWPCLPSSRANAFLRLEPRPRLQAYLFDGLSLALHPTGPNVTMSVWPSGCVCQAVRAGFEPDDGSAHPRRICPLEALPELQFFLWGDMGSRFDLVDSRKLLI